MIITGKEDVLPLLAYQDCPIVIFGHEWETESVITPLSDGAIICFYQDDADLVLVFGSGLILKLLGHGFTSHHTYVMIIWD